MMQRMEDVGRNIILDQVALSVRKIPAFALLSDPENFEDSNLVAEENFTYVRC